MVSGFVTSPCDQLRMTSAEARRIRMELKAARRRCSRSSTRLNPSFPLVMPNGDWSSVSKLIGSPLDRRPMRPFRYANDGAQTSSNCTSRHRLWSSLTSTLKDSGTLGSVVLLPFTIDLYHHSH